LATYQGDKVSSKSPYKVEKDYFKELPDDARQWMDRYIKACEYGNMEVLYELCEEAPSDQFEQIKAEIAYEREFYRRDQYTIPLQYNSTYTEWSYGWEQGTKNANKRSQIDQMYETESTNKNMRWAK